MLLSWMSQGGWAIAPTVVYEELCLRGGSDPHSQAPNSWYGNEVKLTASDLHSAN